MDMRPFHAVLQLILLAVFFNVPTAAFSQNLRDQARQQAVQNPGVPIYQPAPPDGHYPKLVEELAREADLVVHATLSHPHSYLSPGEDRILTDYAIQKPNVIAGRLPQVSARVPGQRVPLILTVWGGVVTLEGVPVRGKDQNRESIRDGGEYLLFLRQSRQPEPGRYEIYYGGAFEILAGEKVKPLLKRANDVFKDTVDAHLTPLLARVRAATNIP